MNKLSMRLHSSTFVLFALIAAFAAVHPASAADRTHNVILFVPDRLRALMINERTAPAMAALRDRGVNCKNSLALFPTFTMPNSSAMATGHFLGDTGVFSNKVFAGFALVAADGSVTPFLDNDTVLGEADSPAH